MYLMFVCDVCKKRFGNVLEWDLHVKTAHPKARNDAGATETEIEIHPVKLE
jgi:hypothetical protein